MTEGNSPPADQQADDVPALSPTRPDGWPDWLGRRPIPTAERDRLGASIDAHRHAQDQARAQLDLQLTPQFSYLVIDSLTEDDQQPRDEPASAPASASPHASPPATAAPTTRPPNTASPSASPDPTHANASSPYAKRSNRSAATTAGSSPRTFANQDAPHSPARTPC